MISATKLTRKYGDFTAVDNVSFEIDKGEIVGLLGANGAGKTTIMKMMTGYLEPTAGRVSIDGFDIEKDRIKAQTLMGYLPENCPLYPEMSVVDHLDYSAQLNGIDDNDRPDAILDAMEAADLFEKASNPIHKLSRGYRQRVGVAQAILHKPGIVIMDEPTNGLDPSQIKHMRELIKTLAQNSIVILSTHILQEVQAVCDRVIIINRGRLAIDSQLDELRSKSRLLLEVGGEPDGLETMLADFDEIGSYEHTSPEDNRHTYSLKLVNTRPEEIAPRLARAVMKQELDLIALHPQSRDIEAVFAEITAQGMETVEAE